MNFFLFTALLFFATGCNIFPGYFQPDPAESNGVSPDRELPWVPACCEKSPLPEPPVALPQTDDCNKIFTPLELVDIALLNNPETKRSWAVARAAAYQIGVPTSLEYPQVEGTITMAAFKQSENRNVTGLGGVTGGIGVPGYFDELTSDILISYLVLDFGGREAAIESARQALWTSNWLHNRSVQNVVFNVLQAYYNYGAAKGAVIASEENLKNSEKTLASAEAQFQAGTQNKLDYLLAKTNTVNSRLALDTAIGQMNINFGILIHTLGIPQNTCFKVKELPEDIPLDKLDVCVDQWIDLAKSQRPDLAAAWATVKERQSDFVVAYSSGLPTLTAIGDFQRTKFFQHGLSSGFSLEGALQLNIPIFDGFLQKSQIRVAREQIVEALSDMQAVETSVVLDVVESYWNFKTATEAVKTSDEALTYSQQAYEAAYMTYQYGTGTILDLLLAQSNLAQARYQKVLSRAQWLVSLSNIAYSTGTIDVTGVSLNANEIELEMEEVDPCTIDQPCE